MKLGDAAWGDDDDNLDIDDEILGGADADIDNNGNDGAESDIFVPPSAGADPL